jgi:SAM-dependent methyltransferase
VNTAEYARMFEAEETQWWYVGMRAISGALLDGSAPPEGPGRQALVLDAGCGSGNNLVHLAAHGRPIGVDLSPDALAFCRTRGVTVARANLLGLPFAEGSFDLVTSFDVLYHAWVTDDRAALRELVRVLRPGGRLLLRVPALRLLWGAHDEAVHSRHRYTRGEVVCLLQDAGLEVVRASYCNSLLFPVLAARRTLDRISGRHGSDVAFLPPPVETLFRTLLQAEARLIAWGASLPIGASVAAVARKPG